MDWQNVVTNLLNQAQDRAVTTEERQAFTEKAAYLMSKYGITELLNRDTSVPFNVAHIFFELKNPNKIIRSILINGMAQAFDCRAVRTRASGDRIQVFGTPQDLEHVNTLVVSLSIQAILSLMGTEKPDHVHGKTHNHSYLLGFTNEVISRVKAATRKAHSEASSVSTDLVFANRTTAVEQAVAECFPQISTGRTIRAAASASYHDGVRAGKLADINQSRMGGSSQQRALR